MDVKYYTPQVLLLLAILACQIETASGAESPSTENSGFRSARVESSENTTGKDDNGSEKKTTRSEERAIEDCLRGLALVSYTELARNLTSDSTGKTSNSTADGNGVKPPAAAAAKTPASKNDRSDDAFSLRAQKQKYNQYYIDCKRAFQAAVRNNDDEVIAALRGAVKKSIEVLKSNENRITTFYTLNKNGNSQYRALDLNSDIRSLIDNLAALSGEGSRLPLYANWRSTAFTNQFYAGLDLNQVDDEASGNPRLGFLTYFRTGRNLQAVREQVRTCTFEMITCGVWGFAWPHFYLSTSFTSEAELTTEDETPDSALDWEIGAFFPFYIARRGEDAATMEEFMVGLLFTRGGRDIDDADGFLDRKYPGLRIAFNEEMYFDIMKGKSEGLSDRRWQFRGQFPVTEFGGGRLFFGISINFNSFSGRNHNDQESSSIYVTWQTSFDDLWAASD